MSDPDLVSDRIIHLLFTNNDMRVCMQKKCIKPSIKQFPKPNYLCYIFHTTKTL